MNNSKIINKLNIAKRAMLDAAKHLRTVRPDKADQLCGAADWIDEWVKKLELQEGKNL